MGTPVTFDFRGLDPRPEPNLPLSDAVVVRPEYIARCPGVYFVNQPAKADKGAVLILNIMDGEIISRMPEAPGWRAVAMLLSPGDARTLGEELLKRANDLAQ